MIGAGYVIANPTKTGTQSLVQLARENPRLGLIYRSKGHGMTVPSEFADYTRHLVVRDPYQRLCSIYDHARRSKGLSGLRAELPFPRWVSYYLDMRRLWKGNGGACDDMPGMWYNNQADCWRALKGNYFWPLEQIDKLLLTLHLPQISCLNTSPCPHPSYDGVDLARLNDEWAGEDCETFGYLRRQS